MCVLYCGLIWSGTVSSSILGMVWVKNNNGNDKGCCKNALLLLFCEGSKDRSQGGGGNGGCCPFGVSWDLGFFAVLHEFVWAYEYTKGCRILDLTSPMMPRLWAEEGRPPAPVAGVVSVLFRQFD